jgi:hypothetical protein
MDQMIVPDAFTRRRIQADETIAKQVVAGVLPAVEVIVGCAERQIDVPKFVVDGHHLRDIGSAVLLPCAWLPGAGTELAVMWNAVEGPDHLPGTDVEAAHIPGRHEGRLIPSEAPVHPGGPHNDNVTADYRG